jgi:hypothetical protein
LGTFSLNCHPATPAKSVRGLSVGWVQEDSALRLTYRVQGAQHLVLPPAQPAARTDGLWKTTCFEMFLGLSGTAYSEFNFSPSGQWAAYGFHDYRDSAGDWPMAQAPQVSVERQGEDVLAHVRLPLVVLEGARMAGLTAVIEEEGGLLSYWALAHGAKPDFHLRSCFTLSIASAEAP